MYISTFCNVSTFSSHYEYVRVYYNIGHATYSAIQNSCTSPVVVAEQLYSTDITNLA